MFKSAVKNGDGLGSANEYDIGAIEAPTGHGHECFGKKATIARRDQDEPLSMVLVYCELDDGPSDLSAFSLFLPAAGLLLFHWVELAYHAPAASTILNADLASVLILVQPLLPSRSAT